MSIYQSPYPPIGPDRASDAYPLTDFAEVAEIRRTAGRYRVWLRELGPEQFASHEDYMAARELHEWGCNPFEEE